jgi:hypothetical protein
MFKKLLSMIGPRSLLPLTVTAFALAISGCGSSNGGEAALTKAQLIEQGDAICAGAEEGQAKAAAKYSKEHPQAPEERAEVEEAISIVTLPALHKSTEELEGLTPPAADEQDLALILASIRDATKKVEEDPTLVITGKGDPFGKANQLASEYGFEVCSELP